MLANGNSADGVEGFAEAAATQTIGTIETLKASLGLMFPSLSWEQLSVEIPDVGTKVSWFGSGESPEFQLMEESDGSVRVLTMSFCERSEVECVAKELGLVAMGPQAMEVFGG